MYFKSVIFLISIVISHSLSEDVHNTTNRSDSKKSLSKNCANSYSLTCLKLDIVSWVDKLNEEDSYSIIPGVSVVRENSSVKANTAEIVADLARDFPNDPEARLDAFLMKKVSGFINNHSIKLKLWNENEIGTTGRKGGGGGFGGGKGGGGGMAYLLAAGAMMKGTLLALALGALAALAGKALMAALMSLMLSALASLKGHGGGGKTTYEVISKPVYSHSSSHSSAHEDYGHHSGHSGYGRSFDMPPLPLGLQPEYKPAS